MSECRPRALWWKRQMGDGHELLCCHLFLLQLISFSCKESHTLGAMDLKIYSLERNPRLWPDSRNSLETFSKIIVSLWLPYQLTQSYMSSSLFVKLLMQLCVWSFRFCSVAYPDLGFFFAVSGSVILQAGSKPDYAPDYFLFEKTYKINSSWVSWRTFYWWWNIMLLTKFGFQCKNNRKFLWLGSFRIHWILLLLSSWKFLPRYTILCILFHHHIWWVCDLFVQRRL